MQFLCGVSIQSYLDIPLRRCDEAVPSYPIRNIRLFVSTLILFKDFNVLAVLIVSLIAVMYIQQWTVSQKLLKRASNISSR